MLAIGERRMVAQESLGNLGRTLVTLDQLWSYKVMKQVRIAELKSRLSEYLRAVRRGETITVLDRATPVAQIVPLREPPRLRIRKPAAGTPPPNRVRLPKPLSLGVDVVDLLLEERQTQR